MPAPAREFKLFKHMDSILFLLNYIHRTESQSVIFPESWLMRLSLNQTQYSNNPVLQYLGYSLPAELLIFDSTLRAGGPKGPGF
jgi:hypothetical protein